MIVYYRQVEHSGEEPEVIHRSHVASDVAGSLDEATEAAIGNPGRRVTIGVSLSSGRRVRYSVAHYPSETRSRRVMFEE